MTPSSIVVGSATGPCQAQSPSVAGDAATAPGAASPADWACSAPRVAEYLGAIGVRDPLDLARLMARVQDRFDRQVATRLVADATEVGIEETAKLLDEWLAAELGPETSESMMGMARAAVLGGAVKGWVGVWSGRTAQPIGDRIRASCLAPVPDPAPLSMVTQRIDPCCYRLVRRFSKLLRGMRSGSTRGRVPVGQST